MIVNYEAVVSEIKSVIQEYTSSPDYKDNELWQNIVDGLKRSLYIVESVKTSSSYPKTLAGLSSDDLTNLKNWIETRLDAIDQEQKVELYRVGSKYLYSYYIERDEAKSKLLELWESDEQEVSVDIIRVPESEVHEYVD
jgi:hypothetical protein